MGIHFFSFSMEEICSLLYVDKTLKIKLYHENNLQVCWFYLKTAFLFWWSIPKNILGFFCVRMWSCQIFGMASSFTIFVQCPQDLMLVLLFLTNINYPYILNRCCFSILTQLWLPLHNPHSLYYQLLWESIREHSRLFLLEPNFSLLQLAIPITKLLTL